MNAFMQIQVRVAAGQAAATLRALGTSVGGLNAGLAGTSTRSRSATRNLSAWGNQVQWTGRQIQTNWTLPLLLAAGAAAKMQLENEKAFTRISKVYGNAAMSAATVKDELNSLSKAFKELSNRFGVAQSEVLAIAGDWAAAGASGKAMFTAVQTTLEAMVLGEIKAADATKALIAIQAQYGTDAAGLAKIIGTLNSVENETGVSMAGLIQGFSRAAGVARSAGVDYRHLAAMIAALSPAAGSAAEAGTALKTIYSRLASPTRETAQVLGLMGIKMDDVNWKSASAAEQLMILSKSFDGLSDKQKEVVSTVVASRWQINKFSILMRELSSENGYYQKALKATSDDTKIFNQYQRELNAVLSSNPQRMKQIWVMLQNASTDIIQPMIPMLLYLANAVRMLTTAFSNLDPALQKIILLSVLLLVATGPLLRYLGSLVTLLVEFARILLFAFAPFKLIPKLFGAISTAVVATWNAMFATMGVILTGAGRAILASFGYFVMLFPGIMMATQSIWAATWRGAWFALHTVGMMVWAQIAVAWALLLARMRVALTISMVALRTMWAAGFAGLPLVMATVGTLISATWAAVMTRLGIVTAVAMRAVSVVYRNGLLLLAAVQLVVGRVILAAFSGMMMGIAIISSFVWPVVQRIWYGAMTGLYIIVNAGQMAMLAMYRATSLGFSGITFAAGLLIHQAWYAIQLVMQYILLAGQKVMHTIWRLYMFGLAPITAAAGRLIHGIWAATLAGMTALMTAMRPVFAMGWAVLVGIARLGSMGIAAATAFGRVGIAFLATMPMRMAALFRAGFMGLVAIARGGIVALVSLIGGAISAIGWPVIAAVALIVLIVAGFWDEIRAGFDSVVKYFSNSGSGLATAVRNLFGGIGNLIARVFNMLPESVQNAMLAVVRIIASAARKIYELFSYINPFARHSPSLVENVTNGMQVIGQQFTGTMSGIESAVMSAYSTLQKFGGVASSMGGRYQEAQWSDQRASIKKTQPSAVPAFDALTSQVRSLTPLLNQLDAAVKRQQRTVDVWSDKLEAANAALDIQEKKLDKLKDAANSLSTELDDAKSALSDWSNTPIKGQQAMSDAIFANQMASKGLQLQLMKMEQASGSLSDIKSQMSSINGEIDTLQGLRTDLAKGGAGSEILAIYDQQISDLKGKGGNLSGAAKAMEDLQKQIDELDRKGQILDLENSLKFDPLIRQIEQASDSMKEMPFETIMAGVRSSKAEVDRLTAAYEAANKAVENQQKVVDAAAAARDAIQAKYDAEQKKLEKLKDAYDAVSGAVQDINDALQQMSQFADDAISRAEAATRKKNGGAGDRALSPGAQNFKDAAGGNFADVGGDFQIGREGGLGSQADEIDKLTQDLAKQTSGMFAGMNPMGPIKKWWNAAMDWLRKYIGPVFTEIGGLISGAVDDIENPFSGTSKWGEPVGKMTSSVMGMLRKFGKTWLDIFRSVSGFMGKLWKFLQPILEGLWNELVKGLGDVWKEIWPEIKKFKDVLPGIGDAFANIWAIVKPLLAIIGGAIAVTFLLMLNIVKSTIRPMLGIVGDVIGGIIRIFRGIIEFLVGVFTLDFKMVWKGIVDITLGIWDILYGVISGGVKAVIGVLKGIINWIGQVFSFLWDVVKGPFQIAWNWIVFKATGFKNGFIAVFVDVKNWFVKTGSGIMQYLGNAWNASLKWIVTKASEFKNGFLGVVGSINTWLRDKFSGAVDWVGKKFMDGWKALKKFFEDAQDWIAKPLRGGINHAIDAVNTLIRGLNRVSDVLPGLEWHIDLVPKYAAGTGGMPTRRVGSGFKTNGARAIVGEGNPIHPEYVIPTDPMYRRRAVGLFARLAGDLGMGGAGFGGVPAFAGGGIIDKITGAIGSAGNFFKGIGDDLMGHISDGVASYILDPFFKLADPMASQIDWNFGEGLWKSGRGAIKDWAKFADQAAETKFNEGGLASVPAGQVRDWIAKALGIIKEKMTLAKGVYNIAMHESGGNPRAINLWDSNAAAGHPSKGIMQTIDSTFNAYSIKGHKDIWNPVDNIIAGTRYAISRYGRKWLENGGNKDKDGNYIGYASGGVLGRISKAVPSLADGAYIRRKVGGTLVRVGEGRTDEAVVPLPNGVSDLSGGGVTNNNFYGNLVFPNITSPDDAKRFIDNLEDLAAG